MSPMIFAASAEEDLDTACGVARQCKLPRGWIGTRVL